MTDQEVSQSNATETNAQNELLTLALGDNKLLQDKITELQGKQNDLLSQIEILTSQREEALQQLAIRKQHLGLLDLEIAMMSTFDGDMPGKPVDRWIAAIIDSRKRMSELHEENSALRALNDVRGGEWCKQNREEGRGGCGACAHCCNELKERAEVAELQLQKSAAERGQILNESPQAVLNDLQAGDNACAHYEDQRDNLLVLLKQLEWNERDNCPVCQRHKTWGHRGDCPLRIWTE